MGKEKFDDVTLLDAARKYHENGCYDRNVAHIIAKDSNITNEERNLLIKFIYRYNDVLFNNHKNKVLNMSYMRDTILREIGREDLVESPRYPVGNVTAAQLRAIYFYITSNSNK